MQELHTEREKSIAEVHNLKMALVDKDIADERCRAQTNLIEELQRQVEERSATALKHELELIRYRDDKHVLSQETRDRALFLEQELRVKETVLIETRLALQEKSNIYSVLNMPCSETKRIAAIAKRNVQNGL